VPAVALSRAAARVAESGPDGENLAASTWQRLEALPDPRSPQGRIYPLACLIAVAVCAFTAAGNDRFTAVGQWIKRASQEDLARLRAPWDPIAGRYRSPDEKTIRVVLDRLGPRALTRALLGPRPRGRRRPGGGKAAATTPLPPKPSTPPRPRLDRNGTFTEHAGALGRAAHIVKSLRRAARICRARIRRWKSEGSFRSTPGSCL